VNPITGSHTVQAQTCTDTMGHELTVSSAWGTLHC